MAQPTLSQEDTKALEQTRQRLFQLTHNIGSLRASVLSANPLPPWSSLQSSASILSTNIKTLTDYLSAHSDLLSRAVVYPQTNYPGRTQEALLGHLLRKKLEPAVESWVEEGRAAQEGGVPGSVTDGVDELWRWAGEWIGGRVAQYAMGEGVDVYTVDERENGIENVNTGLRRKLEEDDTSGDDDEDMEGVVETSVQKAGSKQAEYGTGEVKKNPNGKVRSIEEILRFATTGSVARGAMK
ncbi:hypothetical protein B7494_g8287 [Chlorociboria aeruginascens]|nr:hypothetical protein B7494_g8287 [Chlorociboria aeruginascens]